MLGAATAFIITPAPIDLSRASEESSQLLYLNSRPGQPASRDEPAVALWGVLRLAKVDAAEFARHV